MKLVRDLMTSPVESIREETSLTEAARIMEEKDTGILPVMKDDRVAGILTDRDIVVRGVAKGLDPRETRALTVMSGEPVCCLGEQSEKEAARLMREKRIRRLPVLNREDELVGIVSLGDLASGCEDKEVLAETLEGVSKDSKKKEEEK